MSLDPIARIHDRFGASIVGSGVAMPSASRPAAASAIGDPPPRLLALPAIAPVAQPDRAAAF